MKEECCGTCRYNCYSDNEFTCGCEDSENYGLETGYSDCCDEYDEK